MSLLRSTELAAPVVGMKLPGSMIGRPVAGSISWLPKPTAPPPLPLATLPVSPEVEPNAPLATGPSVPAFSRIARTPKSSVTVSLIFTVAPSWPALRSPPPTLRSSLRKPSA